MENPPGPPTHRIVVGVDGSGESKAALLWAARQAHLTGAHLEVVATWEWPASHGWSVPFPSDYDPVNDVQKMLDQAVAEAQSRYSEVTFRPVIIEGHPAPALVEASLGADLLVVGSRGHGEFAGMLLGSVSEHCVSNAHCPVLVLRPDGQ